MTYELTNHVENWVPPASMCVCVCTGRTVSSEPPHYDSGVFVYQSTAPPRPLSPSPAPEITVNAVQPPPLQPLPLLIMLTVSAFEEAYLKWQTFSSHISHFLIWMKRTDGVINRVLKKHWEGGRVRKKECKRGGEKKRRVVENKWEQPSLQGLLNGLWHEFINS